MPAEGCSTWPNAFELFPACRGLMCRAMFPGMKQINPYNPLDLETLGQSLIREMERRRPEPLTSVGAFVGSGVYFLYYVGQSYPYAEMGSFNATHDCVVPIYVGRAKDTGAREGSSPFDPVTKPLLFNRLREHKGSITKAERKENSRYPLALADFRVRYLVSMPLWVPLAEAMAIRGYRPLWNSKLQGFGIHAPGSGRGLQRQSEWDVLHPGREFAATLPPNERAAEDLAARAHAEAVLAVRRLAKERDLSLPPELDTPGLTAPQSAPNA